jgi:NTP pyrophosphatase (non-canonical NTP hydrolase)
MAFTEELADVSLYLLEIASISGIDLESAISKNLIRITHDHGTKWLTKGPMDPEFVDN